MSGAAPAGGAGGRGPARLHLRLEGFEGPLDLLLDLARARKVDLGPLSVADLADQFLAVVEDARRVRLELAADWLVMAAWLAWLKSRLLLPPDPGAEDEGDGLAGDLEERLAELAAMRAAGAWLGARPRLGRDVLARGLPEALRVEDRSGLALELPALLRAYVAARRRGAGRAAWRPAPRRPWTVRAALARLGALLGAGPSDWAVLEAFLPEHLRAAPGSDPLERRAALASTLLAGLELARSGAAELRQDRAFGPVLLRATAPGVVRG